jgi:iron complex outermembrane recepter protein
VGGAFSPRLAISYRPMNSLLLRASAGKSFRAPDLQRLFGAETAAFEDLVDTPTCVAAGGLRGTPLAGLPAGAHDPCVDAAQSTETRTGANRELSEEKGENASFGVVYEPFNGFSVSADFWYIKLEQIVNTPDTQFILGSLQPNRP